MSTEPKKPMKLTLVANDKVKVTVDEDVAFQSKLLENMVTDLRISDEAQLTDLLVSNVDGWTLTKIMEWCETHRGEIFKPKEAHENPRTSLTDQDRQFLAVTSDQLFNMLTGANYLDIPGLMEIITQKIAEMIDDKTVEEIREVYGLVNDWNSAEEEEEVKKRFEWVEA